MKKFNIILFFSFFILAIFLQIILFDSLIKLYNLQKFLFFFKKFDDISSHAIYIIDNYEGIKKDSQCAIFKLPSLLQENKISFENFDFVLLYFLDNKFFFKLLPNSLSLRNPKSIFFKNISDVNFRFIGNVIEITLNIDGFNFSCDFYIENKFKKLTNLKKELF